MAVIDPKTFPKPTSDLDQTGEQQVVLAGGCFWCTEGVFEKLPGVTDVTSGYTGGEDGPTSYEAVCRGTTGHAEAIRITYDADQITFGQLLRIFFAVAHDPTQLNRQGNDVGTQYRSAIFYANEDQNRVAAEYIQTLDDAGVFPSAIVTTLEPLGEFLEAEAYHQDFMQHNPCQPYVCATGLPKVRKLDAWLASEAAA
ncbi:MAG: peptide-methionine (S)-S-oxide reductase MsrA [Planctomycetota bacterium]